MTRKEIISVLFLAAAVMAVSPGLTWSQSVGETQSERSGKSPGTPSLPSDKAQSNKDTSVGRHPKRAIWR